MAFRSEITEMINEKHVALDQIFNDNIAKLAEKMETMDSRNQESVTQLSRDLDQRMERPGLNITQKIGKNMVHQELESFEIFFLFFSL